MSKNATIQLLNADTFRFCKAPKASCPRGATHIVTWDTSAKTLTSHRCPEHAKEFAEENDLPYEPAHRGLHTHRFDRNPEELRFANAWEEQNRHGRNLAHLLNTGDIHNPPDPSERDIVVAATVVQWLGSDVGHSFLEQLGYVKKGE